MHLVKERLKLNPLLVTYNKYFNSPLGIRNLANLRISFNCDILIQNVNPVSVRRITRTTLRAFGSIYWHCLAGQTVYPVQVAVRCQVPLIVWGAHQGLEQVGMFSHEHNVQMTRRYRKDHDLMTYEADDLLSVFDTLGEKDVWQYRYPDDTDLRRTGVLGLYLGNYVRWDPKAQHEEMIGRYGYRTHAFSRTFDCYDHVDCFNYMNIHDQLKLYKHGYSKVTDHACREIRYGRLTREQGATLVRRFQHGRAEYTSLFCDWLGVTRRGLQHLMDLHRNRLLWQETSAGSWVLKSDDDAIDAGDGQGTRVGDSCTFAATAGTDDFERQGYTVIGKGYP